MTTTNLILHGVHTRHKELSSHKATASKGYDSNAREAAADLSGVTGFRNGVFFSPNSDLSSVDSRACLVQRHCRPPQSSSIVLHSLSRRFRKCISSEAISVESGRLVHPRHPSAGSIAKYRVESACGRAAFRPTQEHCKPVAK